MIPNLQQRKFVTQLFDDCPQKHKQFALTSLKKKQANKMLVTLPYKHYSSHIININNLFEQR